MNQNQAFEKETIQRLVAAKQRARGIKDEDERYHATSSVAHQVHGFVTGNELMFSPSTMARSKEIRRKVERRRRKMAVAAGLLKPPMAALTVGGKVRGIKNH